VCTFITIWLGQMVSSIGSRMTVFAITIWAWELTHSATAFGESFFPAPSVAIALYSSNCRSLKSQAFDYARRHGCRIGTIAILLLHLGGNVQLWHIYLAVAINGLLVSSNSGIRGVNLDARI